MRGTFVLRDGELVPKHLAPPIMSRGPRSALPTPHVISDCQDPLKSMADGRIYESKSAMRRAYRERGYVELGSDAPTKAEPVDRPQVRRDLEDGLRAIKQGYKPEAPSVPIIPED